MSFQYLAKGIYAGVIAFLGTTIAVLQAGVDGQGVALESWLVIGLATVVAFGGVVGLQEAPAKVATSVRTGD